MVESIQHVLSRVRPPRVQITYDVEIGDAIEKKELPFVIGVISDLVAKSEKPLPSLKERKFIEIDRDNFDAVMGALQPRLQFSVAKAAAFTSVFSGDAAAKGAKPDAKAAPAKDPKAKDAKPAGDADEGGADKMAVELVFNTLDDFSPIAVVKRLPVLNAAYEKRVALNDLVGAIDGSDILGDQLSNLLNDTALRDKIAAEGQKEGAPAPECEKILETARLPRPGHDDEKPRLIKLIQLFATELAAQAEPVKGDIYAFVMGQIAALDRGISAQLDAVLHHEDFQRLEGSWRGFHYLVFKAETSTRLKIRVLPISWKEFGDDLQKAVEFDQSQMFKKIYEEEYGTFGGAPYSCLVLDFPISRHPVDVDIISKFSGIAAAAHAPVMAQADPSLFNLESFRDIGTPRDLSKIFESSEFVKWTSFRDSPDSRYISLMLPRVLMRPPYGPESQPVEEFNYEEQVDGENNERFCWGNPAFVMAERIAHAFALYSWTAAIRGVEGGGLVEGLPTYTFKTSRGDAELKCPTEVVITDRREKELSDLGFLALCHCKGTDYAAFFGGQTTQKPKKYNTDDANANALISSRLPYVLTAARFAHYVKAIMRDKVGSFMERADVEAFLQNWLADYVLLSDTASQESKCRFPLREGRVVVKEVPGSPGAYRAVLFLRPHFQLEELTVSLRLVAKLPQSAA